MLRYIVGGVAGVLAILAVSFVGVVAGAAGDWPFNSFGQAIWKLQRYLPGRSFLNGPRGDGDAVVIIKLGLGIAYCKGHAATIAVRSKRGFREVAIARTLRGVTSRTIGLAAARLDAGTYYIVHGRCHVRRRVHNVGKRTGRRRNGSTQYATSYAKFTIKSGEVLNAGFLRFFPAKRGRGLTIKLQKIPRADLRFLARRYRKLTDNMTGRLMQRTNAKGNLLHRARPAKPVAAKRTQPRRRPVRPVKRVMPAPVIRQPSMTPDPISPDKPIRPKLIPFKPIPFKPAPRKVVPAVKRVPAIKRVPNIAPVIRAPKQRPPAQPDGSMTERQRRAACDALLQLKRDGKVKALPVTCLNLSLPGDDDGNDSGLPPAAGADK